MTLQELNDHVEATAERLDCEIELRVWRAGRVYIATARSVGSKIQIACAHAPTLGGAIEALVRKMETVE